jgi:hypothetical protein
MNLAVLLSDPETARQASSPSKMAAIHQQYGNSPYQKLGAPAGAQHQYKAKRLTAIPPHVPSVVLCVTTRN